MLEMLGLRPPNAPCYMYCKEEACSSSSVVCFLMTYASLLEPLLDRLRGQMLNKLISDYQDLLASNSRQKQRQWR